MLEYNRRATGALTNAPARRVAIVSSSTPEGLVEQSVRLCERFDCTGTGLSSAIKIAREYATDSEPLGLQETGVGTELSKLIPKWATQFDGACGCKDFAKKMDSWGVSGCEARKDSIVAHLLSQSDHLIPAFRLIPEAGKRVAANLLLNKAIRNARKA